MSKIQKIQDYYKQIYIKDEQNIGQAIQNQTLKFFFNLFITLSYGLFSLAIILNIDNASQFDKFKQFATNSSQLPFSICLIILIIIIYSFMKTYKQDNRLTAIRRKSLNFYTDIARIITYIITLIFIQPFVFQLQDNITLFISFWLFIAALTIFIIRKILKWRYFKFGSGKEIIEPWLNKKENRMILPLLKDLIGQLKNQENLSAQSMIRTVQVKQKKNLLQNMISHKIQ